MKKIPVSLLTIASLAILTLSASADIKIRQKVTTSGQSFESTRSIKGARERTEQKMVMDDPSMAAYMPQIATITQCDLKRTVRLNDRQKLFMVEPFQVDAEPVTRSKPEPTRTTTTTRSGGTITMTYTVNDTGERKTLFGMQARHLIITQEMETSADSCNGPSKMKMEFDGWYVDFSADFNCPNAQPAAPIQPHRAAKPDCMDKMVYKGNAAARLGFLLDGTMKMFGADGSVQMTQTTQTLELSRAPLDAALFDVPVAYKQVSSSQDLYAIKMPDASAMMQDQADRPSQSANSSGAIAEPSGKSVGVNITLPAGSSGSQAEIDDYVRGRIASRGLRAVSGTGDFTLTIQFKQIKESTAGKIGGMFSRATGVPSGGVGKVDIDMTATISGGSTGEAKIKNKFDGPLIYAVQTAINQALDQLLSGIGN